jgi:LPXTG-site transpeptidase (sortase) family protein
MSVKLLTSAKSGVLLYPTTVSPAWQRAAIAVGAIVIIVGGLDLLARTSHFLEAHMPVVPNGALAPLGTLELPQVEAQANVPAAFVPIVLRIPSIEVNAPVERVALKADGATMAAPKNFTDVAWYSPGPRPGDDGNAVFAGHLNSPILGIAGVFDKLSQVQAGDQIVVEGAKGEMLTYSVTESKEYITATAPTEEIFKRTGPSQLVLITCEGTWDPKTKTFNKRLVVIATLLR